MTTTFNIDILKDAIFANRSDTDVTFQTPDGTVVKIKDADPQKDGLQIGDVTVYKNGSDGKAEVYKGKNFTTGQLRSLEEFVKKTDNGTPGWKINLGKKAIRRVVAMEGKEREGVIKLDPENLINSIRHQCRLRAARLESSFGTLNDPKTSKVNKQGARDNIAQSIADLEAIREYINGAVEDKPSYSRPIDLLKLTGNEIDRLLVDTNDSLEKLATN